MELFIPSLVVVVLSAFVIFVFLPKMAPYTLGFLALALFAFGIWQNYKMFPHEYRGTMILQNLKDYSPFVMVTLIIVGGMITILSIFGPAPPSIAAVIPEAVPANIVKATNTNVVPSFFNLSGNTNANTNKPNGANGANATKRNNATNKGNNIASTSFKVV